MHFYSQFAAVILSQASNPGSCHLTILKKADEVERFRNVKENHPYKKLNLKLLGYTSITLMFYHTRCNM
jgi:hypothetical protein